MACPRTRHSLVFIPLAFAIAKDLHLRGSADRDYLIMVLRENARFILGTGRGCTKWQANAIEFPVTNLPNSLIKLKTANLQRIQFSAAININ